MQKSHNFHHHDDGLSISDGRQTFSVKGKGHPDDDEQKLPLNEDEDDNLRHQMRSLQVGGNEGGSTVSDDGNPTPTSGHDDGYHTEAGSWNRGEYNNKHNPSVIGSPNNGIMQDYAIQIPTMEDPTSYPHHLEDPSYGGDLPGYQGNPLYSDIATYGLQRPSSTSRYTPQYGMEATAAAGALYDPTTLTNPKHVGVAPRCTSAMAVERSLSPTAHSHLQRNYSDRKNYPVDYYPRSSPMHMLNEAEPKIGLLPQSFYPAPILSSHSSLDKMESGSTLSAIPSRVGDQFETSSHLGRMSQSSRSSSRPLTTRMATHV